MLSKKKKRIKYLRSVWGKEIEKYRNFDLISAFHNLKIDSGDRDEETFVDEKTWSDLDFDFLFEKLDGNVSGIGQQYLYHILKKYEKSEKKLKKRFELFSAMKDNQTLRESVQLNLFGLAGVSSYFIAYLLYGKSLPFTKYYPVFFVFSALSIISLILIAANGVFLFIALAVLLINLIVHKIFSKKIYEYFTGFSAFNSLIGSAVAVSKIKSTNNVDEIVFLKKKKNLLVSLRKKLGYLVVDKEQLNDLALIAIDYMNMFMLFDVIAYYRSVNALLKNREDLRAVFEAVASLDAAVSVASYLEGNPDYCNPVFDDSDEISFTNLRHPLIENAVPNTLENISGSVLITGSNMSGKTTFIKTVGINALLSQTLYFCLSEEFKTPKMYVQSAIRRDGNLEEGKSYFFAEIERIKDFMKLSESDNKYLFLIDEIFRGTNTIERLAASTAVLKYLGRKNKVFVTTHDVELQELLKESFSMHHFSEQVEGDEFFFNYKIKSGPCSSGNAIKLLEIMNYPKSVIDEANFRADKLLSNNSIL